MRIMVEPDLPGESITADTFDGLCEGAVVGWANSPVGPGVVPVIRDYRSGPPVFLRGLVSALDLQLFLSAGGAPEG